MTESEENIEENIVTEHKVIIRSFRAIDDYESCKRFFDGHTKVLTDLGITNLNTTDPEWMFDELVYVVLAEDTEGSAIGGLRIHVYEGQASIPLIGALQYLDENIVTVMNNQRHVGTSEVCGLWNSRKVFGKGISAILCICSVVIVRQLSLKTFFCFSAPYTEKMIKSNGCIDVTELGENGRFNYPTEKFISIVLWNPDVERLEFAAVYNKERITSLTYTPIQDTCETGPRGTLNIHFDLSATAKT